MLALVCGAPLTVALLTGTGTPSSAAVDEPAPELVRRDLNPGPMADVNGTRLTSGADPAHGQELWATDGTDAGTVLVKDIHPGAAGSSPQSLVAVGPQVYFTADDGAHGYELWRSDGTRAGTVMVADLEPGPGSGAPDHTPIFRMGDLAYFFRGGTELWRSDGTAAGTWRVRTVGTGHAPTYVVAGDTLYFSGDAGRSGELWRSDGTTAGTVLVRDVDPAPDAGSIGALIPIGDVLYFTAVDSAHGASVWKTDGTGAGTVLLKAFGPASGTFADYGVAHDGDLYFTAATRSVDDGFWTTELWRSAGTAGGTTRVATLEASTFSPAGGSMFSLNGVLLLSADNALWRSDGTAAGTYHLSDTPGDGGLCWSAEFPCQLSTMVAFRGRAYFTSGQVGSEVWATDGTVDGTVMVTDIYPGPQSSNAYVVSASSDALLLGAWDSGERDRWGGFSGPSSLWKLAPGPKCNDLTPTITGSGTIVGTPHDDVIVGSDGADVINGRGGNDVICAGSGDDTISSGTSVDGTDTILGEAGLDTISYSSRTSAVTVDLTTSAAVAGETGEGDRLLGIENATGGTGNDTLTGNRYRNALTGGPGNDTLAGAGGPDQEYGGTGDDTFWHGAVNGADLLNGQAGTDTVNYSHRTTAVTVTLGGTLGNDGAPGEGDTLAQVENLVGTTAGDTLTGNTTPNRFRGGPGNDVLRLRDGIEANDHADGGTGTDTATVDPGDTVTNIP